MNHNHVARRVREIARAEGFHRGPRLTYQDIARHVRGVRSRFICEQAELAGWPVWASAPDSALRQGR